MTTEFSTLLLPGMDGTGELFAPFVAHLPERFHPVVVRFPVDQPLGYAALEERVLRERVPKDRPWAMIAESFSGPLALRIAAKKPPGLVAVVLVATFVRNPVWWFPRGLRFLVGGWLFRFPMPDVMVRRNLTGGKNPELSRAIRTAVRQVKPHVMAARARDILAVDVRQELRQCPVPILYLAGLRDRIVSPRTASQWQTIRPDLRVVTLDAPHLVLQTRAEEAARVIGEFLDSTKVQKRYE